MSGKDSIIEKILSDAKVTSEKTIEEARLKADEIVSSAKSQAEEYKSKEVAVAEASISDILKRKVTVANLEVRKIILQSKQEVIDRVFKDALESITSLPKDEYKSLIFGMLKAEAQDNDIVTVSARDKDIITAAFILDAGKKLNKKLRMNETYGNFNGGIILTSGAYDKNLTLDVELGMLREEMEPEIAATIFGESK